jgi:hypothetical protein
MSHPEQVLFQFSLPAQIGLSHRANAPLPEPPDS